MPAGATTDQGVSIFAGGRQLNSTMSVVFMSFRSTPRIGAFPRVEIKMIGKPCVGECKYGLMRGNRPWFHGGFQTGTKLETTDTAKGFTYQNN